MTYEEGERAAGSASAPPTAERGGASGHPTPSAYNPFAIKHSQKPISDPWKESLQKMAIEMRLGFYNTPTDTQQELVNAVTQLSRLRMAMQECGGEDEESSASSVAGSSTPITGPVTRARACLVASSHQMPLVEAPGTADPVYNPWRLADLTALRNDLPVLHNGGGLWVQALKQLTAGVTLEMGNIRSIISVCSYPDDLNKIAVLANTAQLAANVPLGAHAQNILNAVKRLLPVSARVMVDFSNPWTSEEQGTAAAWVQQATVKWTAMTSETPGKGTAAQVMMKAKILTGVPSEVENQMSDNPLIPGALWDQWANCLTSRLDIYQKKNKHLQDQAAGAHIPDAGIAHSYEKHADTRPFDNPALDP